MNRKITLIITITRCVFFSQVNAQNYIDYERAVKKIFLNPSAFTLKMFPLIIKKYNKEEQVKELLSLNTYFKALEYETVDNITTFANKKYSVFGRWC